MRGTWTLVVCLVLSPVIAAWPASAAPSFEWHDLFDGGIQQFDLGTVALTDGDGNLVIGGESAGPAGSIDMLIRKLDRQTGDVIWQTRQAAHDGNDMAVTGMVWDGDGDLLVGGTRLGCLG